MNILSSSQNCDILYGVQNAANVASKSLTLLIIIRKPQAIYRWLSWLLSFSNNGKIAPAAFVISVSLGTIFVLIISLIISYTCYLGDFPHFQQESIWHQIYVVNWGFFQSCGLAFMIWY